MKRWHDEIPLMQKRMKMEKHKHELHGVDSFEDCHCSDGIGTMRKHTPYEGYNHRARYILACDQYEKKRRNKKIRQMRIREE